MFGRIKAFFAPRFPKRSVSWAGRAYDTARIRPLALAFPKFDGEGDPKPGYWKAAHKRTRARFKAELTCPMGHGMTLKNHIVIADGLLIPSVVCRHPGCDFHEWVKLRGWTFGELT